MIARVVNLLLFHVLGSLAEPDDDVLPVLLIPGYASSQLHAWRSERCGALGQDVGIGDRVWINVAHLIAQKECWLKCMSLRMEDQADVSCKLRAGEGISSIAELAPGLLTGPMSIVWRKVIETLTGHFDLGPHQLMVASYDWRLPPSKLQERDHYFYTMRQKIEDSVVQTQSRGIVVLAHSLGNNVFRYFLEWLKQQIQDPKDYEEWIEKHIVSYFAVGAPFLGSSETIEALTAGVTASLPLAKETLRKLQVSFGSTQWMLPFPRDPNDPKANETLITIKYPSILSPETQLTRNFSLFDITNGNFHREMQDLDPNFHDLDYLYQRYYANDPILNPHTPWTRPPIKSVHVVYGTGLSVRNRYTFTKVGDDTWETTSVQGEAPDHETCNKSGDGTVHYDSLAWGHTWLGQDGDSVKITRIPQAPFFNATIVKTSQSIRLKYGIYSHDRCKNNITNQMDGTKPTNSNFLSDMMWSKDTTKGPYINFYEYTDSHTHTSVWEMDQVPHREILINPSFLRELKHELREIFGTGRAHAPKVFRPPHHDSDCYWNYLAARCEFSDYCQYDYKFGDVTLDQSCRIKKLLVPLWKDPHMSIKPIRETLPDPVFKHVIHEYTAQCEKTFPKT